MSDQPFIKPEYGEQKEAGSTIANIPATAAALLDIPFEGLPPLGEDLWRPLRTAGKIRRVVVLLIDAMGSNLFHPGEGSLASLDGGRTSTAGEITSVCPSTTVNALSSLWTGQPPGRHGLVGVRLHFPEYGAVGNMLSMSPNFTRAPDALVKAGLEPDTFLGVPGTAEQFAAADVPTYSFKPAEILNTALSRMHDRGCRAVNGAYSFADMLWQMGQLLEEQAQRPLYAFGYWPSVDLLSHRYGMTHPAVRVEVDALLAQIKEILLERLSPEAREGTVFLLAADHGQMLVDADKTILLEEHPMLRPLLLLDGAGEPRMPYLYVRQGQVAAVRRYAADHLAEMITLVDADTFLGDGWLGRQVDPAAAGRVGDLIGLLKPGAVFIPPVDQRLLGYMIGMHGGVSPAEMLVPFRGLRL